MWITGVIFTLVRGIHRDPWGIGVFDLDLLTLLTGYLFLSFGRIQAGVFALAQGLLIDIFSSGPNGLTGLVYIIVYWTIYLGSLFFNFQTTKGQIIIVSLAVFFKNLTWLAATGLLYGSILFSTTFFCAAAVSILGTGLLCPVIYTIFDRFRGIPGREKDTPALEDLEGRPWEDDHY